jgi:single-stranded-DNA-specific exonuclease
MNKAAFKSPVKRITRAPQNEKRAFEIANTHNLSSITAQILAAREYFDDTELKNFLTPTLNQGLPNAKYLFSLKEGCKVITSAIFAKTPIAVSCDFDVDGLSAGAQLIDLLKSAGSEAHLFVPDRFREGYGLNSQIIDDAHKFGCKVLVTLDFGTSNFAELSYARTLGMRSIVVDHHHVDAGHQPVDIFINPNQKQCGFANKILSASGLTWYLVAALRSYLEGHYTFDPRTYLDLAALGTICDMVPLQGVNRVIASKGLDVLANTSRPGLKMLLQVAGVTKKPRTHDVSFGIGPRLNAAGRMVHGGMVIELLTTKSMERACEIAHKLNDLNQERQREEKRVLERTITELENLSELPAGIVSFSPENHTGVIGIVAQRIVERYYRPAAIMGRGEDGILKGSVRGIKGISVVGLLETCSSHLVKFGGHEGAGGFSIKFEKLSAFCSDFVLACQEKMYPEISMPTVKVDTEASLNDLTFKLLEELAAFDPCGMGNHGPVLLLKGVRVEKITPLKNGHLKIVFSDGSRSIDGLFWKCESHPHLYPLALVNIAIRPEINSFGGVDRIQANIQAVEAHIL